MSFSRPLLIVFYAAAWLAFVAMLSIHVMAYFRIDVEELLPLAWVLYPLTLLVAAPSIQVGRDLAGAFRRPDYWELALRYAPRALRYASYGVFLYAWVNFFACLYLLRFGSPGHFNGHPALLDHGALHRYITPSQYQNMKAYETRMLSGIFMAFDLVSAAILCSAKNAPPDFDRNPAVLVPPPGSSI